MKTIRYTIEFDLPDEKATPRRVEGIRQMIRKFMLQQCMSIYYGVMSQVYISEGSTEPSANEPAK